MCTGTREEFFTLCFVLFRDFLLYGGKPLHPELNLKSVPMYGAFIKSLKAIAHDGSKVKAKGVNEPRPKKFDAW